MKIREWVTLFVVAGYSVFPICTGSKRPACKWKCYQDRVVSSDEINAWNHGNLGVVTGRISNIVVVDCDTRENAEWFIRNRGDTPMKTITRRGMHLYFKWPNGFRIDEKLRNAAHVKDEYGVSRYDLRAEGGFVMAPPSEVAGFDYQFHDGIVPACKLPTFWIDWLPENRFESQVRLPPAPRPEPSASRMKWALREIAKIKAVSGAGGHNATFRVAGLLQWAGFGRDRAYEELCAWNETNAEPRWSEKEIAHKIDDMFGRK